MKFASLFVLCSLVSGLAHADMIKPATLNLTCKFQKDSRKVILISKAEGSIVTINQKPVFRGSQLTGGTEGGGPYLQAVGGGINLTLSGGDFEKAFYANATIKNGSAPATLWESATNQSKKGVCKGLFSF